MTDRRRSAGPVVDVLTVVIMVAVRAVDVDIIYKIIIMSIINMHLMIHMVGMRTIPMFSDLS